MEGQEDNLADEQQQNVPPQKTLSDEEFEAELVKRLGAGSKDLIKKTQQLSAEEVAANESKRQSDILKFGLEQNLITAKDQEEYIEAKKDKIAIARKKFIKQHPELGEKAAKEFDAIFRLDEEDEVEGIDEVSVPNESKKIARSLAEKIADEEINSRFAPVISLSQKYDEHLTRQELRKVNSELISHTITSLPKKMEIELDGDKYSIAISPEDFAAAQEMVEKDVLEKKGLTPEEIKANTGLFLKVKNFDRIVKEIRDAAVSEAIDKTQRGRIGVVPERKDLPQGSDEKLKFLKQRDIQVGG